MAIATKHQEVEGNMLCGNGCQVCASMKTGTKFERNGEERTVKYEIGNPSTCDTRFVVYLIRCLVCSGHSKKAYVGSTGRPVKERIVDHRESIAGASTSGIKKLISHFTNCGLENFQFMVLEKLDPDMDNLLNKLRFREGYWIQKLQTIEYGWNESTLELQMMEGYDAIRHKHCFEIINELELKIEKLQLENTNLRASKD